MNNTIYFFIKKGSNLYDIKEVLIFWDYALKVFRDTYVS